MTMLNSVSFFALAAALFVVVGASVAALLARFGAARLRRWDPRARHVALTVLLALPIGSAVTMMLATTAPSWLGLWLPQLDHCLHHDDTHAHLCFVHLPVVHMHPLVEACLLALVAWMLVRAALFVTELARALRVTRTLARTGERDEALDATILDAEQPVCMAAGLLQPSVLVSRGLLAALDDEGKKVVLAHERAHIARRDALCGTLGRLLAAFHFSWVARWLVHELDVAAEQACDEEAAAVVGDRLSVAAVIVQVQRMTQGYRADTATPLAVSLVQHAVERRVESLLAQEPARTSVRAVLSVVAAAAVALAALSGELHHLTEFVLSGLTQ